MTDRRLTPANGRVAHVSLKGIVQAEFYVEGTASRIAVPLTDLCIRPDGPRDRQLLLGAAVLVLDRQSGWAFVQARYDGYVGWVVETALGQPIPPTHAVCARATHLYPEPAVRMRELASLSLGAEVAVLAQTGSFAETTGGFIPLVHIRPLTRPFADPVAVAELLLGTPYLWGGNSAFGIDCSGLVQLACHACGIDCPGDSDMQSDALGTPLDPGATLKRGDLIFWKGHVATVADDRRIIHANGHSMSVAYEGIEDAQARIAAEGTPVLARRRLV